MSNVITFSQWVRSLVAASETGGWVLEELEGTYTGNGDVPRTTWWLWCYYQKRLGKDR